MLEVVYRGPYGLESVNAFCRLVCHHVCHRGGLFFGRHDICPHDSDPCLCLYPCPYPGRGRGLYLCLYLCRRRTSICQIFEYCAWLATVTAVKSGEKVLPSY